MNKKKTIAVAIVLALLLLIGGMLAYFTDTDSKANKFTLGEQSVNITLTETQWSTTDEDRDGVPDAAEDVIPGKSLHKNPVIKNDSTTNSVCVFAEVVVPLANDSTTPLFTYTLNNGWVEVGTPKTADGKTTHVYAYGTSSTMTEVTARGETATPVFSTVTFNSALTADKLTNVNTAQQIDVNAYGIQYENLSSYAPATVWPLANPNANN